MYVYFILSINIYKFLVLVPTCKLCIALPADSLLLKFTNAQYFSGKQRTLVTFPYLQYQNEKINFTPAVQKSRCTASV